MALEGDMKYEEISACCESVVALFSDKADVAAVRESGRMIADLHATQEERHKEVCEAIRELTGQLNKAKTDHAERKSTLLDETQKQQLDGDALPVRKVWLDAAVRRKAKVLADQKMFAQEMKL